MSSSPLRTGLQTLQSSWRHFGLRQTVLQAGMLGVVAAGRASMALDEVFHREYHDVEVRRPVFIIGAPRSGTTFFHRLLTQTNEFPCWHTWELFVPSLTARNIVHPLVPHVVRVLGKGFQDDSTLMGEAHRTSSDSIEEEEMLFVLRLDSQFVNVFTPVGFDERDHEDLVYADAQPDAQRLASARFLKGCLQRQIAYTGRTQVVAKLPYSTLRVRTLLEVFPDARFVYLVRSPLETIPSHLSLHRKFFQQRYGLANIPPELLARYWERRFRYNVALYRYFHEVMAAGALPEDQVLTIRYPDMRKHLDDVFARFLDFTGIDASPALRAVVAKQATRQAGYKREHENLSLADFGLDRAEVIESLRFVFETYNFPT